MQLKCQNVCQIPQNKFNSFAQSKWKEDRNVGSKVQTFNFPECTPFQQLIKVRVLHVARACSLISFFFMLTWGSCQKRLCAHFYAPESVCSLVRLANHHRSD